MAVFSRTLAGGRLSFEHGGKRVEIGAALTEPDRQWLFETLEKWRQSMG